MPGITSLRKPALVVPATPKRRAFPAATSSRKGTATALASPRNHAKLKPTSPRPRALVSLSSPRTRAMVASSSPRTRSKVALSNARTPAMVASSSPRARAKPAAKTSTTRNTSFMTTSPRVLATPATVPAKEGVASVATKSPKRTLATAKAAVETNAAQNPQKARQPSRCSKCTGRPMRSECIHTIAGRAFLASKAKPTQEIGCQEFSNRQGGRAILQELRMERIEDIFYQQCGLVDANPGANVSPGVPAINSEAGIGLARVESQDPLQVDSSMDEIMNQPLTPPDDSVGNLSPSEQSPLSTHSSSRQSPPSVARNTPCPLRKKKALFHTKKKATMRNPIYGLVHGAKRGNKHYVTYRTHKLPAPRQSSLDITRRFARQINKILQKCEDLAAETGCWLFLGAQHVTARAGAICYASPRICREAQEATEQMATLFNATAAQLLIARRAEAVDLQRKLEAVQQRKIAIEKALEEASARVSEYQKRFGRLDAALET